ncbi:putative RNA polymerase II subunit B1 CTD phosphatase rtr1 [Rhodotorula toruloides]|nr:putative RNA polymerase II subunit B1 CTD phosphatase rtr1 [Rhodotorula toruloides]
MPSLPPPRPPNPSSFRVATSSHPRSHQTDTSDLSTFQSSFLSRALSTAGPSSLALKLSWIERLTNPAGVAVEELREAAAVLDRASWEDLVEERWMEGRCPYPTCSRPAGEAYRPPAEREQDSKRLKFRLHANGLFEAPRREEGKGAYCSAECRARSEWYAGLVGRGKSAEGEMLEDVEERRREVVNSTEELVRQRQAEEAKLGPGKGKAKEEEPRGKTDDFRQDLLSSLTIREHDPSSTAVPLPPSLDAPVQDFERPRRVEPPSSSSSKPSRSTRFPASPAPRSGSSSATTSSSTGSSLLPFSTTRLSKSVLSSLPPAPPARPPNGLPPIRFLGVPRTVDDDSLAEFEEEENDEVRKMVEEGLRERNEARRRGEIE